MPLARTPASVYRSSDFNIHARSHAVFAPVAARAVRCRRRMRCILLPRSRIHAPQQCTHPSTHITPSRHLTAPTTNHYRTTINHNYHHATTPTQPPPRYHHLHHPRAPPSPRPHRTPTLRIGTFARSVAWRRCPRATRSWPHTRRRRSKRTLYGRAAISMSPRLGRSGVLAMICLLGPRPHHLLRCSGRRRPALRPSPQHLLRGRGKRRPALIP